MICPHCNENINTLEYWDGTSGNCPKCKVLIFPEKPAEKEIEIILPGTGKLISEFTKEASEELKDKNTLFYKVDSKEIVEIGEITTEINGEEIETYTGFLEIKPNRFITLIEKYFTPGIIVKTKKGEELFVEKSINSELARTMLTSHILEKALPQITRIFTIPIPIILNGELTFPKKGYDPRFNSWLPNNAPEITEPEMELVKAKSILKNLFKEFCFEEQEDFDIAIAGLLTPFLRGLYSAFNKRTPVFFYLANRERAGKDYLAGITGLVYEGNSIEESPLSSGERSSNNNEELRKKIMSALMTGRKRMHFSNNRGYIDNAVFEGIITSEYHSDRVLGKNEILTFANELEFSLSGNTGVGFTADFANRCRIIRLLLDIENANERNFSNPNLHGWVLENRSLILSALYALIRNWIEKGKPKGSLPFASFPEWAKICGGVMEAAGYGNPCKLDVKSETITGDLETTSMKMLFELCFDAFPNQGINKKAIVSIVEDNELFHYLDLEKRSDQTKFGNLLNKFVKRTLSGITLKVDDVNKRGSRREYVFSNQVDSKKLVDFGV